MSNLSTVYQYFTLEQWKQIVSSLQNNPNLSPQDLQKLLIKMPSAAL